jgi:hypothetical protein
MRDSSVSSRAVVPPVGSSNINAREIQCVQKDSGSFWA